MREICTSGVTREGVAGLTVRPLYSIGSIVFFFLTFTASDGR